jgi:hypothetical protein
MQVVVDLVLEEGLLARVADELVLRLAEQCVVETGVGRREQPDRVAGPGLVETERSASSSGRSSTEAGAGTGCTG